MAVGAPTQTRRGANDIAFTLSDGSTLRLHIFRDRTHRIRVSREAAPAEEGQQARYRETAKVWRDWRRGAGFEVADEGTEGGYGYGSFVTSWVRGQLGPAGYIEELTLPPGVASRLNRSFEFGGHLYYTCGNTKILKVPSLTGSPADSGATVTSGATTDADIFGSKVWITNGQGTRIWSFDGTTWAAAAEDVRRSRFTIVNWVLGATMAGAGMSAGAPYRILLSSGGSSDLYHCSGDPGVVGNHVGPNAVGDSAYALQRLIATSEAAFALKPDGPYMVQGGGRMPNLAPEVRDQFHPSNGAVAAFYDGWLFYGTTQALLMVSPDTSNLGLAVAVQPGANESFEASPVYGRPTALLVADGWLFAAFWNGDQSFVMRGKLAERLGMRNRSPMIWYGPEFECNGQIIDMRMVIPTDDSQPRLMYYAVNDSASAETVGTPRLHRQEHPRAPTPYAAYRRNENYRSVAAWSAVMSAEDLGDPDAPKIARFFGAVAENLGGENSLTISTNTDVAAADVTQALLTTSPRDYAVADTSPGRGHLITVTASVLNNPALPVWVRAIKMRGTVQDEKTVVFTLPVVLGRVGNNVGTEELRDARTQAARLYGLLEEGPVGFVDWMNRDMTAVLEGIQEEEVEDKDSKSVTRVATLTISVLLNVARYGEAIYGSGRYS